jgi:hypothetical protein
MEGGKATGVKLRGGGVVKANKAVISNASVWDTLKMVPEDQVPSEVRGQGSLFESNLTRSNNSSRISPIFCYFMPVLACSLPDVLMKIETCTALKLVILIFLWYPVSVCLFDGHVLSCKHNINKLNR